MRKNKEQSVRIMMSWLALDRDVAERSYDMALDSFSEDGSPSRKGFDDQYRTVWSQGRGFPGQGF